MANIGKAMGGSGGFSIESPTFKIIMREYEDMSTVKDVKALLRYDSLQV